MLPLIFPAILAGALFAFTLSLDEFVITYFLIGGDNTLPIFIYTQIKYGITPEVNALASLLLMSSILLMGAAFTLPQVFRVVRRFVRSRLRVRLPASWRPTGRAGLTCRAGQRSSRRPSGRSPRCSRSSFRFVRREERDRAGGLVGLDQPPNGCSGCV